MKIGEEVEFVAKVLPEDSTDRSVSWTIDTVRFSESSRTDTSIKLKALKVVSGAGVTAKTNLGGLIKTVAVTVTN